MRATVYRCDAPGCAVQRDSGSQQTYGFTHPAPPTGWLRVRLLDPDEPSSTRDYDLCSAACHESVLDVLAKVMGGRP